MEVLIIKRRRYKQALVSVLTDICDDKLNQAVTETWGSFAGKAIRIKSRETLKKYLELLKEELGV